MGDKQRGFVFGDHEFLHPSENGPLERIAAPKRQILGAPPPSYLEGIAREATNSSTAAKALRVGRFCGHGEPTMTVFDVVIDGGDIVEIGAIEDPGDSEQKRNLIALVARKPGSEWKTLFRREWEVALEGLSRIAVVAGRFRENRELWNCTRRDRLRILMRCDFARRCRLAHDRCAL
jgi:hypothetical protein